MCLQVEQLQDVGANELQRRRSLEATLKQAASLFRRELASKTNEVAALQAQLRAVRHELSTSNAFTAAAVAEMGAARAAAAASASAVAAPAVGSHTFAAPCCSPSAATQEVLSPPGCIRCGGEGSPAAAKTADNILQPRIGSSGGDASASAAAVIASELQALRAARSTYQAEVLKQQSVRNSLLGSLGSVLEVSLVISGSGCHWPNSESSSTSPQQA